MDAQLLAEIRKTALPLPRGAMDLQALGELMMQAEKKVSIEARALDFLRRLKVRVDDFIESSPESLMTREDWLELCRLARHGKRIAIRFDVAGMRTYFGVLLNTASTYLGLPGDRDQRQEAYALTATSKAAKAVIVAGHAP